MERLKRWVRGGDTGGRSTERTSPSVPQNPAAPHPLTNEGLGSPVGAVYERHSHGLEQFFSQIQHEQGAWVLDLGGVTQANVGFITSLGDKLFAEDFPRAISGMQNAGQSDSTGGMEPEQVELFLRQNLNFRDAQFDGVLLWDALEFLPVPLLKAAVRRLYRIMKPGAHLLAFFHATERAESVPIYSYRIADAQTLHLAHREMRSPVQLFNNRDVEKLFDEFQSVKFFLARDHLREVIVRR